MNVDIQQGNNKKLLGGTSGKGFMPGQSGNLNGRPKGKTLKEFAREYLMSLPDDEKMEYLGKLPKEIVWKMAEGMPKQDTEFSGEINLPTPIANVRRNNSISEDK